MTKELIAGMTLVLFIIGLTSAAAKEGNSDPAEPRSGVTAKDLSSGGPA